MNPLPLPLLPPPAQFVDLRPSDTLLVMKSMQWLNHISPRLFLFMKTFFRLLRNLTPDGTLEKVFHLFFLHKALNQLQAIWPLINPIAKISKALYYEFEVAGPTNEHRWIE